jgi:N-methylhydantoinase A/oxoprolinase/acetone carboxylase beta subunit
MAETMLVGVDVGATFIDLVLVDRRATDKLRRRGRR